MPVSFEIKVTPPLSDEDRQFLTGLGMMTVAIAQQPDAPTEGPPPPEEEPQELRTPQTKGKCGVFEYISSENGRSTTASGRICVRPDGHRGEHNYNWVTT